MTVVRKTGQIFEPVTGSPTLDRLDGEARSPLAVLMHPSWTDEERAAYGVYLVDTTAPEGQQWTGAYQEDAEGAPEPVFEDIPPPPPPTNAAVDQERDRRVDGAMTFGGVVYQTRPQDRENVAGASIMALAAMVGGAQPGDLRWHGGESDFVWIAADNSLNAMDAQSFFAFGQAMAGHKSAHIFAARALKDTNPIPEDFTADSYWP